MATISVDAELIAALFAELDELREQKRLHADNCRGVQQDGHRGDGYHETQERYLVLIRSLEGRLRRMGVDL